MHGAPTLSSTPPHPKPGSGTVPPHTVRGQDWAGVPNSSHLQLLLRGMGGVASPSASRTPQHPSCDSRARAHGGLCPSLRETSQLWLGLLGVARGKGVRGGGRSWAWNWAHRGLRCFILVMALTEGKGAGEDLRVLCGGRGWGAVIPRHPSLLPQLMPGRQGGWGGGGGQGRRELPGDSLPACVRVNHEDGEGFHGSFPVCLLPIRCAFPALGHLPRAK